MYYVCKFMYIYLFSYIYTRMKARAKARAFILAFTRLWSEVWYRYNHVKTTIRRPLPLTNICMETHEGGMIWIECKRNRPRGEHIYLNRAKGMPLSFSKQVTYLKAVYDGGQHLSKKVFKTMEIITNELRNERRESPNATLRKCWEKETANDSTWRLLARFGAPPVHRLEFGWGS